MSFAVPSPDDAARHLLQADAYAPPHPPLLPKKDAAGRKGHARHPEWQRQITGGHRVKQPTEVVLRL